MERTAQLSADGMYRYRLGRTWGVGPRLAFIMLNPSLADTERDDPTVTRCIKRAMTDGFGGLDVVNLFALRSPYPRALAAHPDPIGPENDAAIERAATSARMVICAWGAHPFAKPRARNVVAMLRGINRDLFALAITQGGHPQHPLHLAYAVRPIPFEV